MGLTNGGGGLELLDSSRSSGTLELSETLPDGTAGDEDDFYGSLVELGYAICEVAYYSAIVCGFGGAGAGQDIGADFYDQ